MVGLDDRLIDKISLLSEQEKIDLLLQLENLEADKNRRTHPRFPFFTEVTYVDDQNRTISEFVRDLSVGGMFIETDAPLQVGQTIQARFPLPGFGDDICLPAKVVRLTEAGMGVRFKRPLSQRLRHFLPSFAFGERRIALRAYAKAVLKEHLSDTILRKCKAQQKRLQHVLRPVNKIWHKGNQHYCPICESLIKRFQPRYNNNERRPAARCPICQSLERHRLDSLFLQHKTALFSPTSTRLLHVAPEAMFEKLFAQNKFITSVTIDLKERASDVRGDLTRLPFPADSFDAIYCSHVLEHIPDDRQALAELYRVLSPSGWALIQVPITSRTTFEDTSITEPLMRAKLFGQHDHFRRYGMDFSEKLANAGFSTDVYTAGDIVSENARLIQAGIQPNRRIFYCRKI